MKIGIWLYNAKVSAHMKFKSMRHWNIHSTHKEKLHSTERNTHPTHNGKEHTPSTRRAALPRSWCNNVAGRTVSHTWTCLMYTLHISFLQQISDLYQCTWLFCNNNNKKIRLLHMVFNKEIRII